MDEKQGAATGQGGVTSGAGTRGFGNGPNVQDRSYGESTGGMADQARETFGEAAGRASEAARSAYDQGQRVARQAGERYPQVRQYYERGTRVIGQQVAEAPLVSLLAMGAAGFALAWLMGGSHARTQERRPSSGRSRQDRPGQRSGKPLIESDRVEGTAVYDRSGNRIGTIKRVMLDKISGRVAYAVLSFGGFFGIGADEYAVPWNMLDYDTSLEGYRTGLTAEQLRNAPGFSKDRSHDWSNRDSERQLHDYYRVDYYWLVG